MYLADLSKAEIEQLLTSWGEPKYRAGQVWDWLNRGARVNEMTNLPAKLRERLETLN